MKLEYYVLNYDFNKKEIYFMNIFGKQITNDIKKELDNFITYDDFKEKLRKEFTYRYRCKREYEILCGDAFVKNTEELTKIDVYLQIEANLDMIVNYCIEQYNNRPYARKTIEL